VVEFALGYDAVLFILRLSPRRVWMDDVDGSTCTSRCSFLPFVKRRGICDIDNDRHGGLFEMTMGGTFVPVLVRQDMSCVSSWKLTCNSPRLVERQAGGGKVRSAGDLRAIVVDFSQLETFSVSDVEAKVLGLEHKECR